MKKHIYILIVHIFCLSNFVFAQEKVIPLKENAVLENQAIKPVILKKKRASLPFIDDFSNKGPFPDANFWTDKQAFVNNTFSETPITKGVATLDGLNEVGRPYFASQSAKGFADSLTSQPIDLSSYSSTSNLFLSFFYQPQGLGFAPETHDSLILFYKNNLNEWNRIWKIRGSTIQSFRYVTLAITDTQYLHADFQFRFVNIASLDLNNDTWNLDYIKLDANRSYLDSVNNDIAFNNQPVSILSPYSSMPYRHFLANQANEKAGSHTSYIANLYPQNKQVNVHHIATELQSGTSLSIDNLPTATSFAYSTLINNFTMFNVSYVAPNNYSKVVIEDKYYFDAINTTDRKNNDTITNEVIFDNYFAYDDGSAEKSYFLQPAFNYAAKTALEFHLNQPDSIRGLMIHFGPQVPTGLGKVFTMVLYKSLSGNVLTDSIIMKKELNSLMYESYLNGFSSYAFDTPKLLDAGKYYIGITQPANFGSDSIYYGLDVNNNTNLQYLSYNVDGTWLSSLTQGSLMMRPIVGQAFTPTAVSSTHYLSNSIKIYPNPSADIVFIESKNKINSIKIMTISGQMISTENVVQNQFSIQQLPSGLYIVELTDEQNNKTYQKINKL